MLARRLGFGEEDAAGCLKWLRSVGTVPAHASGRAEMELETRPALRSLDALEAARRRRGSRKATAGSGAGSSGAGGHMVGGVRNGGAGDTGRLAGIVVVDSSSTARVGCTHDRGK